MAHVFISHVEEDQGITFEIAAALEAAGYRTWYYERDGISGMSYLVQTTQAVDDSRAMVLIVSAHSLGSHQVTREVVRAYEGAKPFLPVLIDVSHGEFQTRQPEWRAAVGAAASVSVRDRGLPAVFSALIKGLQALGLPPDQAPSPVTLRDRPGFLENTVLVKETGVTEVLDLKTQVLPPLPPGPRPATPARTPPPMSAKPLRAPERPANAERRPAWFETKWLGRIAVVVVVLLLVAIGVLYRLSQQPATSDQVATTGESAVSVEPVNAPPIPPPTAADGSLGAAPGAASPTSAAPRAPATPSVPTAPPVRAPSAPQQPTAPAAVTDRAPQFTPAPASTTSAVKEPAKEAVLVQPVTPTIVKPATPAVVEKPTQLPVERLTPTTRDRQADERYAEAKKLLDSGSFSKAIVLLETMQTEAPGYKDVSALLASAREMMHAATKQALEAGTSLERSGDLAGALQQYSRLRQIDPSMATVSEQSANRVKARMMAEGADAFKRAKYYDALDVTASAITWYERAYRTLPDEDPDKKTAKERLDILRSKK